MKNTLIDLLKLSFLLISTFFFAELNAQEIQWSWEGGSEVHPYTSIYGVKGVPDSDNVPGIRQDAVSWADASGNLWLFGGQGYDAFGVSGYLNDLWKYDGTNWTWVSGSNEVKASGNYGDIGVADSNNFPGARLGSVGWLDSSGDFWLFGGYGYDSDGFLGRLNDLWKFDGTNWIWISGSKFRGEPGNYGVKGTGDTNNVPGGRSSSAGWVDDSGNLWLFGGAGYGESNSSGRLNDLWKFDGINWTWINGSSTVNSVGVYGTKGVADANNVPGSRSSSAYWSDGSGNFWLFGGSASGIINDLWKFDGANWTWVSGSNTTYSTGNYGDKGVPAVTNEPGARHMAVGWTDQFGNSWLFGGLGFDENPSTDYLNDLWKFDGANWTWVSGSKTNKALGSYGEKGVSDENNEPGGRRPAANWVSSSGDLWLFGGLGYSGEGPTRFLNDLWKFDATGWAWINGSSTQYSPGVYGTQGVAVDNNIPGARAGGISWTNDSGNLWLFGGYGTDGHGGHGALNDIWRYDGMRWTWIGGSDRANTAGNYGIQNITEPSNIPGARSFAISWFDTSGNLWLFGGSGVDEYGERGWLNDLWKYDGVNWTWVSGSKEVNSLGDYGEKGVVAASNVPGSRIGSVAWLDLSGNLWLFGGTGYDDTGAQVKLNDLWKFDGTNWTWVSGSNTPDAIGIYGTKGIANSENVPGARDRIVGWTDSSGSFWLFGGDGFDSEGRTGGLNDLWRFDGSSWTWVSGSNIRDVPGSYGTKEEPNSSNVPGAREGSMSWVDTSDNLWLFGGYGHASGEGIYNDLWKYDGVNWTWVGGSDLYNAIGNYGLKGVSSSDNEPGARTLAVSWKDNSGNIWLFGGSGLDSFGFKGALNDMWKMQCSTIWYADVDGDGYGDASSTLVQCSQPLNYVLDNTDCDDSNAAINPESVWYADADGDGYGDSSVFLVQCIKPTGYVLDDSDCDDIDVAINTGAVWYADKDGDGFGDIEDTLISCDQPASYVVDNTDCDDSNAAINPETIWYVDNDGDGYGYIVDRLVQCDQPDGYVISNDDCDDSTAAINPASIWYADTDGDGYGDASNTLVQCTEPLNYVLDNTDCDDLDKNVYPEAPTLPDGKDNDCDRSIDKLGQTIFFDSLEDQDIDQGSLTLLATTSSNLNVTFSVIDGPASLNGNVINFEGVGVVIVEASQEGNEGYLPADPVRHSFEIVKVTGLTDSIMPLDLFVYPNPVTSKLLINDPSQGISHISIVNSEGKIIKSITVNMPLKELDVSELRPGIYNIIIKDEKGIRVSRFHKE
ncbi:MAG: kelch repeat-containing protein [Fulvivirga sp.]